MATTLHSADAQVLKKRRFFSASPGAPLQQQEQGHTDAQGCESDLQPVRDGVGEASAREFLRQCWLSNGGWGGSWCIDWRHTTVAAIWVAFESAAVATIAGGVANVVAVGAVSVGGADLIATDRWRSRGVGWRQTVGL